MLLTPFVISFVSDEFFIDLENVKYEDDLKLIIILNGKEKIFEFDWYYEEESGDCSGDHIKEYWDVSDQYQKLKMVEEQVENWLSQRIQFKAFNNK